MIRPEVSDDLFNEVKILSGNALGSFDDSLRVVVEELKKLKRRSKAV